MPKQISDFDAGRIVEAISKGDTFTAVAKRFGRSHAGILKLVKRYKAKGSFMRQAGSGKSKTWTVRSARLAAKLIRTGACRTATEILRLWNGTPLERHKIDTIRRMLRSQGLRGRSRKKKPLLSAANKKKRLLFAKKYQSWTPEDWRKVIFTDETRIKRFGSDSEHWCWRMTNEPVSARTTKPTVKADRGDFMIWGCFGYHGVGWAAKISGTMNSDLYLEVLEDEFKRSLEHCIEEHHQSDIMLLQDNAPCHKSGKVMDYLSAQSYGVLDFPPMSPDLNPIENLWSILKRNLHRNQVHRKSDELWEHFEREWEQLNGKYLRSLVDSMPRRILAVIKAKGGTTRY